MENYRKKLFSLKGKVAIVTGAAGQLGGEYVRTLLDAGAKVAAFDVFLNNPKGKLSTIKSKYFMMITVDITQKKSIKNGLLSVISRFGNPTVLINNAALDTPPGSMRLHTGLFETYPQEAWEAMINVNLTGMFLCCQIIGGYMAKKTGGSIINISSIYGMLSPDQRIYEYKKETFFKPLAYSVTKAGVLNLTRYLATYWAKRRIRVNTLILGGVFNKQDKIFLKKYTQKTPLGRMAYQHEYNGAVVFLASDASSYMTGANLVIDGGYSCW